jgi:mannose-6-phosphate isomerase
MTVHLLTPRPVARAWGRRSLELGGRVLATAAEPIGELWFEPPPGVQEPLLLKLLFTSQPLSVQVHPGDADARASGHAFGKEEAWYVLEADAGAEVALGLLRPTTPAALRRLAQSGAIETALRRFSVRPGDFIHVPPGTLHAIGAGLVLAEVQQRIDLTYRLYDYGRPRALQIDDAIDVAHPGPAPLPCAEQLLAPGRRRLVGGGAFAIELWDAQEDEELCPPKPGSAWLLPLAGQLRIEGLDMCLVPGQCALITTPKRLSWAGPPGRLLVAASDGRT